MRTSHPTSPSSAAPQILLPLLVTLLFDVLLLSRHLTVVEGFEPLIQLKPCDNVGGRLESKKVVSVHDFGAVGDGVSDDTKAFKDAWETACASPSRKTILKVPEGNRYLVKPINFTGPCCSNMTLRILGSIIAPSNPAIWRKLNPHKWLYFHGINHFTVRGGGTIDGMGERWWSRSCKIKRMSPCRPAPTALTFHKCKHLKVHNLTMVNSQQMHVAFISCFEVKAHHLKVFAPAKSPNTDGIHISGSVSVKVHRSLIKTGDDCISIVSGSSKVRLHNIDCGSGHGISIGSLGKSKSWAEVHDVQVDGATISNTENGLRIKTWQGGRGFVRDIVFQNVTMINVSNPIIIDQYYCDSFFRCLNQTSAVEVDRVSYTNITGTSATEKAVIFACSDSHPCENIFVKDVQLSLASGGNATAFCWKAGGFGFGLMEPPSCLSGDDYPIQQKVPSGTALHSSAR